MITSLKLIGLLTGIIALAIGWNDTLTFAQTLLHTAAVFMMLGIACEWLWKTWNGDRR